jgi:hypothetical protein
MLRQGEGFPFDIGQAEIGRRLGQKFFGSNPSSAVVAVRRPAARRNNGADERQRGKSEKGAIECNGGLT